MSSQTAGARSHADSDHRVFIARQPIVDRGGRVFGYELLYREAEADAACDRTGTPISAEVLTQAILGLGLDTLTGGHPAFLNFSRDVLLSGIGTLLPPETTVIELLESVRADQDVVDACRLLHGAGYRIALDDFVDGSSAEALLPFAAFVKVDVLSTPPHLMGRIARRLAPSGITLIAEKVETDDIVATASAVGYKLFQGYHFCRPTTMSGGAIAPAKLTQIQLLGALTDRDLTIDKLEAIIARDVALSYRVLRCVSSAAFGLSVEIQSIRQALVLLGVDHIRKWAVVWSLAALNANRAPELVTVALVRARCAELLSARLKIGSGAEYFLLGLCSLLDVMLQVPMARAVSDIPLSDTVKAALLGTRGPARSILDAVVAYERGQWEEAANALAPLGLPALVLPMVYADALDWPRAFNRAS